jgi:cysteine-rich repeat protein
VQATIRATVEGAACLSEASTCGDGVVEGGEECDDSNTISGDGCSSTCLIETTCGDGVKEGHEECDDGNTTADDGCSPTCRREECGNRIVDPGEECDDGNAVAGDGCTPDCIREPRCGDGIVDPGEECDDGGTADGDGCSALCAVELCIVERSHQTLWAPATVKIVHGNGSDRLAIRGRFGIPARPAGLAAQDVRLVVRSALGPALVDLTLPGDGGWATKQNRQRFRDGAGAHNGIRRVQMKTQETGDITEIDLKVAGKGGKYPVGPADLPIGVTVVFGGEAGGQAAQCGHYVFGAGACTAKRRGRRIVCR